MALHHVVIRILCRWVLIPIIGGQDTKPTEKTLNNAVQVHSFR